MAKRIKQVVSEDMVAHLWAHKAQDHARTPGQGRMYFDGDTIYSYGSHFPIARHVTHNGKPGGRPAILFTTRDYSNTTRKHKYCAQRACSHLTVFLVHNIYGSHKVHLLDYKERLAEAAKDYAKAKGRKPEHLARMRSIVSQGNAYAAFFGLKTRFEIPGNETELDAECVKILAANAIRREKNAAASQAKWEARAAEERKRHAEAEGLLQQWVDGELLSTPNYAYYFPTRLRIKQDADDGAVVQTSKGAEVPLEHALRAFKFIAKVYESGQPWESNGHTIKMGHFQVDRIETDGTLVAGCHRIGRDEIERIAKLAGVA